MHNSVVWSWRAALLRGLLVLAACLGPCAGALALPEDGACLDCHKDLVANPAALRGAAFGCAKCHMAADTAMVPHNNLGLFKGGRIPKVSRSCLACHDKPVYARLRHGGLGLACTGCHNAHAPKHGQLVTPEATGLCFSCHERKEFEAAHVHEPVAQGTCTDCHAVHATEHANLLSEPLTKVCMDCHGKVKRRPHATVDMSGKGHPIGGEKPDLMNPLRPKEPFYCGSCHDPHMSQHPRLMRFDLKAPLGFCQECHKK
jgi:predicted CXXCH cytochrome family protein